MGPLMGELYETRDRSPHLLIAYHPSLRQTMFEEVILYFTILR